MRNLDKWPEFKEFYQERLQSKPWDWERNPRGFPPEQGHVSSDIAAHLPLLQYFASQCEHITEFGTRGCFSTSAFIAGCQLNGLVVSYDIHSNSIIQYLQELNKKKKLPCRWVFEQKNTISEDCRIEPTELLMVDSLHNYYQVSSELKKHGRQVQKYLVFHDTYSQGLESVDRPGEGGILKAIIEYTENEWNLIYQCDFNHGLMVYERNLTKRHE